MLIESRPERKHQKCIFGSISKAHGRYNFTLLLVYELGSNTPHLHFVALVIACCYPLFYLTFGLREIFHCTVGVILDHLEGIKKMSRFIWSSTSPILV